MGECGAVPKRTQPSEPAVTPRCTTIVYDGVFPPEICEGRSEERDGRQGTRNLKNGNGEERRI